MKKTLLTITMVLYCNLTIFSQNITLQDCYDKVMTNYPLAKNSEFLTKSNEYNISNAIKGWLPDISLSGKASYQSDVTSLPIEIPNIEIPQLSKDQYGIVLEVNQTIYDGGAINSATKVIKAQNNALERKQEVDMYALKERINQVFFGILVIDEQLNQNSLLQEDLDITYKKVMACVDNGVANNSDLDRVSVAKINAKQQRIQLKQMRSAYIDILSIYINEPLKDNVTLQTPPSFYIDNTLENSRPELLWFEAQNELLNTKEKNLQASYMPELSAFVQGGYGRPNLNMLNDDFNFYYIAGIRLKWNIHSLYTNKNDKHLIETSRNINQMNKENFLFNNNVQSVQQQSSIITLEKQMEDDQQIIDLRSSIRKSAELRVENGTMSVSDLLTEINNENIAKQNQKIHRIELLKKQYELKTTLGK